MRRLRPAYVEQFFQENGVVLRRLQQSLAVARVDRRLVAGEKPRSDPCARCSEREDGGKATAVGDPTGGNVGDTASTTAGTRGKVATVPRTWPPASQPCATTTSTPQSTARRAASAVPTV